MTRIAAVIALVSSAALAETPASAQAAAAADFAYPGSKTYTPRTTFSAKQKKGHEKSVAVAEAAVKDTSLLVYSTADSIDKVLAHYAAVGAKKGLQKFLEEDLAVRKGKLVGYMATDPMRIVSVQIYPKCSDEDLMDGERPPADQRLIYVDVK
jgi:hypothetical protein